VNLLGSKYETPKVIDYCPRVIGTSPRRRDVYALTAFPAASP